MSTKNRIIEQSITLFNEYGYSNVSLHQIAKALDLSSGNLTYHFPKKASLMDAVYSAFVDELISMQSTLGKSSSIENIFFELKGFIKFQKRFRFFYIDLLDIGRNYPTIAKRHYKHIEGQISRIHENLVYNLKEGVILSEFEGELRTLAETIWLTVVFWPSQMIIRGKKNISTELLIAVKSQLKPYLKSEYIINQHSFSEN